MKLKKIGKDDERETFKERERLKYERQHIPVNHINLVFIIALMAVIVSSMLMTVMTKEQLITDWEKEVVGLEEGVMSGKATDIHVFLYDENREPIKDANVSVTFDKPGAVHQLNKIMHHVEDGLYETEVIFSDGGHWIGELAAQRGQEIFYDQFLFDVHGSAISEQHRDPDDHFHLGGGTPEQLNNMSP